jgi:hypothetical protein
MTAELVHSAGLSRQDSPLVGTDLVINGGFEMGKSAPPLEVIDLLQIGNPTKQILTLRTVQIHNGKPSEVTTTYLYRAPVSIFDSNGTLPTDLEDVAHHQKGSSVPVDFTDRGPGTIWQGTPSTTSLFRNIVIGYDATDRPIGVKVQVSSKERFPQKANQVPGETGTRIKRIPLRGVPRQRRG